MSPEINILQKTGEQRKKTSYFRLNPGCLIGILILTYEIIPIKLGSFPSPISNNQPGYFVHCSGGDSEPVISFCLLFFSGDVLFFLTQPMAPEINV